MASHHLKRAYSLKTQDSFEDFVDTSISSYKKVFVEDLRVTTQ